MAKQFTYNDNLGNILDSSPEPATGSGVAAYGGSSTNHNAYEGFGNYVVLDETDYEMYSETSPDAPAKYTVLAKPKKEGPGPTVEHSKSNPPIPDVFGSNNKMSTINTVYIGSLTIVGLYVLFRYMKY